MAPSPERRLPDLEEAFRLEKDRQDRLRAELGELTDVQTQAVRTARILRILGLTLAALLFAALSAVMLSDPSSARGWMVVLVIAAMAGAWRYFQRSK